MTPPLSGPATSADFDAVAAEMDGYIAKLLSKPFTGNHLRSAHESAKGDLRSTAVGAIDCYHGFTCEFSPSPAQHRSEYDTLEALLEGREL